MGDRDLVVDSTLGPVAYAKQEKDVIESITEAACLRAVELARDAFTLGPMDEDEAQGLSRRQRRIWAAANLPRAEMPGWMLSAFNFHIACSRREVDARDARRLNITQNNYISLPPPLAPAPLEEVKIVDIEQLKPEDEE